MGFADSINICLRKFADFSGRAARPEFWWFIAAVYFWATAAVWLATYVPTDHTWLLPYLIGGLFLCPVLAVFSRRMHDIGLPGWLAILIYLSMWGVSALYWAYIPDSLYHPEVEVLIGHLGWALPAAIALFPSQPGPNTYGPNPNEVTP